MSLIAAALKPQSILIATDFSDASEKALRYSLALARFYESKFCLAHVVSSLCLTMAGPGAIAACEEAVSREAASLEDSLIQAGALPAFNTHSSFGRVNCGRSCDRSS